eukprot:m.72254 g.72254  ORF g.72254 m.72254 type:complete len:397 (+) comp14241_c2_seq1:408-1598(+)
MGGNQAKQLKFVKQANPHLDWQIIDELGSGTYGKVHKVRHRTTGDVAAAKSAPIAEDQLFNFADEVAILATCRHPAITGFVDGFYYDSHLWLLIEVCSGGSLSDIMRRRNTPMTEEQNRCICRQLLDGLAFLHGQLVIHRDLNASNILLGDGGLVKLADFGVSAKLKGEQRKRTSFIGTPNWMAPEVVACEKSKATPYGFEVDIWSFGITLIELAERRAPFHDVHPMKVLFKIVSAPPPTFTEPERWSPACNEFLSKCVIKDPYKRPQAVVLLQHEFVQIKDSTGPLLELLPGEQVKTRVEQPDSLPDSPVKEEEPQPPQRPARRASAASSTSSASTSVSPQRPPPRSVPPPIIPAKQAPSVPIVPIAPPESTPAPAPAPAMAVPTGQHPQQRQPV